MSMIIYNYTDVIINHDSHLSKFLMTNRVNDVDDRLLSPTIEADDK